jgi:hypothetical protein
MMHSRVDASLAILVRVGGRAFAILGAIMLTVITPRRGGALRMRGRRITAVL